MRIVVNKLGLLPQFAQQGHLMTSSHIKALLTEPAHNRLVVRRLTMAALILSVALLVVVIATLTLVLRGNINRFFPITENGQILEILGQDAPGMTDIRRAGWVVDQVREATTFSSLNWRIEEKRARHGFDDDAWYEFQTALAEKGWWSAITTKGQNLRTVIRSVPVLLNVGSRSGEYIWEYHIDLLHEWEGNGVRRAQRTKAIVFVKRVSLSIIPSGMQIVSLQLKADG